MIITLFIQCFFAGLLFLCSLSSFAQQKTITGKIIDQESGKPLPGVTILVRGSSTVVTSDEEGSFSITVPSDQSLLEVSSLII